MMLIHLTLIAGMIQPQLDHTTLGPAVAEIDISAVYTYTDRSATGEERHGLAAIAKKDDVYLLRFIDENGTQVFGVGMREGNCLYVAWTQQQAVGICRYQIELRDNQPCLRGDRGASEVLTYLKPL